MKKLLTGFVLLIALMFSGQSYAEHFFMTNNTWYEKIPATPILRSTSAANVDDIILNRSFLTANWRTNNPQIWYATASTPNVTIMSRDCARDVTKCGTGRDADWANWGWNVIPIPLGAKGSGLCQDQKITAWAAGNKYVKAGCDAKMVVINANRTVAWDFGQVYYFPPDFVDPRLAGKYATDSLKRWDLTGNGINYPYDFNGGPTLTKVPLLQGTVTYDEITGPGEIDHALAFAYYSCKETGHWGLYPSGNYYGCFNTNAGALLGGDRVFLDSSVDCNAIATSTFERKICTAIQDYGMILMETDGPGYNEIYLECLDDKGNDWWPIVSTTTLSHIPFTQLHVAKPICDDPSKCGNTITMDSVAPVRTNLLPSGTLPQGTTQTTISLSTDENATCRYDTTDIVYSQMSNTFSTTGTTSHSQLISGLTDGSSYTYYVRCEDAHSNQSITTTSMVFSIDMTSPPAPGPSFIGNGTGSKLGSGGGAKLGP